MIIKSKVLAKLGDHIATEMIAASAFVTSSKPEDLGRIACKGIDPEFVEKMKPGGVLVAGKNFGCSSSREWAPVALKAAGVKLIIAEFFARIFYRNAINVGLPVVEVKGIKDKIDEKDEVEVDFDQGLIRNLTKGKDNHFTPLPPFILEILKMGGAVPYYKSRIGKSKTK